MSRPRFDLFKCALCYIWQELKDKWAERTKMQTRRVTSGRTVTGVRLRLVLTVVSQPPPPASLLLLNTHTQAGHRNPSNNNLTLLFTRTPRRLQERERPVSTAETDHPFILMWRYPSNYCTMWRICRMFQTTAHSMGRMLIPLVLLQQHNNNFRNCYGNPRRGGISAANMTVECSAE